MIYRTIAAAIIATLVVACGNQQSEQSNQDMGAAQAAVAASEPAPKPIPQTLFEGVTIPGTAAQAKASGFTDCELSINGDAMSCRRPATKLFGIPALRAYVKLDSTNYLVASNSEYRAREKLDGKRIEDLTYGSVEYEFYVLSYDMECRGKVVTAHGDCEREHTASDVEEALEKAGWIYVQDADSGQEAYMRSGVGLKISTGPSESLNPDRRKFAVKPIDADWATALVAKAQAKRDAAAAQQGSQQELVDQMKDGTSADDSE